MIENSVALQSPNLAVLLSALPADGVESLARLIVGISGPKRVSGCHLDRSLNVRKLTGHQLVPDIVEDLSVQATHTAGSKPCFRDQLQSIAARHAIEDDGKTPPAAIERQVQRSYLDCLRPKPGLFKDKGSSPWWMPGAISPNWDIVTAAILEIAALRRIEITRAAGLALEHAS